MECGVPSFIEPLAGHRPDVLVLWGLANRAGESDRPGDHARGTASFLTSTPIEHSGVVNGVSCDQVAARALAGRTSIPSLELGVHETSTYGICDSGYSCAYISNIAWAEGSLPLPKISSPRVAFERLFGGVDPSLSQAAREQRLRYQSSVLDLVNGEANALQARLGQRDRDKLDQYLTGVRELELRIAAGEAAACEAGATPPSDVEFQDHARIMADVMAVAFQCDLTRVQTFMLGNGQSGQSFSFLGVSGAHHEISHHQDDPGNFDRLTTIGRWEIEQLAYLLDRLADVPEADGSRLLDHCLVMVGSEIADGNRHSHTDLPVLLCGSGGGAASPGRHVQLPTERPVADLYLSMLQAVGADATSFGDSTGPLSEIAT